MHGEYVDATFTNGKVNVIDPVINPIYMSFSEIKNLANIKGSAHIQERYFRKAFNEARKVISSGGSSSKDFLEIIFTILEDKYNDENSSSNEKTKIMDVMNKVDDLREKIYIALKSIGINPLGRTMSFKKVKNKSVLSLNISERNNKRKSIVFTFAVSDGFFKMNIKSNQSLKNITINLVPLIEDDVRNFFIEVENLNKESLVFYGPIRMTVKKDVKRTRNILPLYRK